MANDLEQKIIKQVEYYFGDYNLPRDKFLKQKVGEDDGWVEFSVLLQFKRLANLTTDTEVIVKALEKSENGIVAVSEDGTKVRRVPEKPLPELDDDRRKHIMDRTAYAKGFPLEEPLDDIIEFMEKQSEIESCMKRCYLDKAVKEHKFKGSCFVVFKTIEDCKKFIEAESIKYKDVELIRKWQNAYYDEKRKEVKNIRTASKKKHSPNEKDEDEKEKETKKTVTYPKGAFLHFSGISKDHVLTREEIKEKIAAINETYAAFIDFNKGDEEGYIRMTDENGAIDFHKKLPEGILEIGDSKLQLKVLEGEEEELYLQKTIESVNNRRHFQKKHSRSNKRKGNNSGGPRTKKGKY